MNFDISELRTDAKRRENGFISFTMRGSYLRMLSEIRLPLEN